MKSPKVAIIISTYNQKKLLEESLESLKKKTDYINYKVYVVDDSGKGEIGKEIEKKFKWVEIIINKNNLGYSQSINRGMKKALKESMPEYILMMNDDMEIIQKDWLRKLVEFAEKDKETGIVGCQQIYPDGSLQDVGGHLKGWELTKILKFKKGAKLNVDHFMGSCMLVKKEVIEKIGLMDEIFTPFLLEDSDYCLRAKKAGYSIKILTSVKIIHKKGKSVGALPNSRHMSVRFKNDIIFSMRNLTLKNALFRIFIYLPLVAVFRKKIDQKKLTDLRNFSLRKDFLSNILLLTKAYFFSLMNIKRIYNKNDN
jgi:GT2 family glycosyltransferase